MVKTVMVRDVADNLYRLRIDSSGVGGISGWSGSLELEGSR
jgi:hypothetical protein